MQEIPENKIPVGYEALKTHYQLNALPHFRVSYVVLKGARQTVYEKKQEIHIYPKKYLPKEPQNMLSQLEFALKYDGIYLELLALVFNKLSETELIQFIKERPLSKFTRRIWYLYEFLTSKRLEIEDLKKGNYYLLVDSGLYYTGMPIRSKRHRIEDNLLGNANFCPMVRKTSELLQHEKEDFKSLATSILEEYDQNIIVRATNYLYMKETRSSYEIEKEQPSQKRAARFVELLKEASRLEYLSKEKLVELQNYTVDPRFAEKDYRNSQNYVGETVSYTYEKVHYISPKPEDVESLMKGLFQCYKRMADAKINPVLIASVISFGFVFIHPFEDGNGRLHRFLIHHILSKLGLTPEGLIFPVSATMLSDLSAYDECLESFSIPLMKQLENYELSELGELSITGNLKECYAFVDFTGIAGYLFSCVKNTIEKDFRNQLEYLVAYDKTKKGIQDIVDMPDRLIDLIFKFILHNHGTLSKTKKQKYFATLTDEEIKKIEALVRENILKKNILEN